MSGQDVSQRRIAAADRASKVKPPAGTKDEQRTHALLLMLVVRSVSLPEPVVVPAMVNGRPPASWEAGLYVEAMHRERRAELEMFRGLIS